MSLFAIDNDNFTLTIYSDDYMEYIVKPGAVIDANTVAETKKKVTDFRHGAKYFVYAEGVEFFTFTKEARALVATGEHLDNVYANAFYTTNISLLLLGEIFIKINKPAVPTKTFNSRQQAKEWLNEQRDKLRKNL